MMRDIIVSLSGGKDSQACLKLMCSRYGASRVLGIFADTQWEHPKTYAHINKMRDLYNVKIDVVKSKHQWGDSVEQQIIGRGLQMAYNYDDFGVSQHKKVIALEEKIGRKHYKSNTGQMCMFCAI